MFFEAPRVSDKGGRIFQLLFHAVGCFCAGCLSLCFQVFHCVERRILPIGLFVTIFFGSALCFLDRKHIVVDVIYNILPRAAIRYLLLFTNAMCIIFCIFLGMAGYRYAIANAAQLTSCMSIPLLYVYIMMPVACALMIISILRAGYREFSKSTHRKRKKMKKGGSQNDITFGRRFSLF